MLLYEEYPYFLQADNVVEFQGVDEHVFCINKLMRNKSIISNNNKLKKNPKLSYSITLKFIIN